jgi:hypothetical protein
MWGAVFDPDRLRLLGAFAGVYAVPMLFYILTLRRALKCCEEPSVSAGSLWVLLLPVLGSIWHFFVVREMCESLRDEFTRRHRRNPDPTIGRSVGIAMCVAGGFCMIPPLTLIALTAHLTLWVLYWVNVREISGLLDARHAKAA